MKKPISNHVCQTALKHKTVLALFLFFAQRLSADTEDYKTKRNVTELEQEKIWANQVHLLLKDPDITSF